LQHDPHLLRHRREPQNHLMVLLLVLLPVALDYDLSNEPFHRLCRLPVRIHLAQRVHHPWSVVLLPGQFVPQPLHRRKPDPIHLLF
jgi:hypothetical protein